MADRVPRFYAAVVPEVGETLELSDAVSKHLRVLRLREDAPVELFDGAGLRAQARVTSVTRSYASVVVVERERVPKPAARLTLLLGMTKGDKPDLVVRMATEMGVSAIRLVTCERSVIVDKGSDKRMQRLHQITLEACGQSGNAHAPALFAPMALLEAAALPDATAARFVFWERATEQAPALAEGVRDVWAVVGPEGGLSETEVNGLRERGFVPCALQTPILRAETAALVVAARLSERLSQLSIP